MTLEFTTPAKFDLYVANKLKQKYNDAKARGIEFDLSFQSMKNLCKAKRCGYTGIVLTHHRYQGTGEPIRPLPTDFTIDRIDAAKGYVAGNVIACCNAANNFKSQLENGGIIDYATASKMFNKIMKKVSKK